MNKIKAVLIFMGMMAFAPSLSAQNYLSKDRENEIKTSGHYYWNECSDFQEEDARQCALDGLKAQVIGDVVKQSIQQNEVLKALEMGVHQDCLEQQGKRKILAWIAKDSVFVTIQYTRALASESKPVSRVKNKVEETPSSAVIPSQQSSQKESTRPASTLVVSDNPVLQELSACKNYREVRRVATTRGIVRSSKFNSSEGFANPAKCIIAVFTTDGTLSALLDTGGSSRIDLLSGKTIQNPEQHYSNEKYVLWYLQQK